VKRVPETEILPALEAQPGQLRQLLAGVSPSRERYRYEKGKWSIRELAGHLVDGERIFGFRAFCFSRGDENAMPGFEEDDYVARGGCDDVPLSTTLDELATVRESNLLVFRRLTDAQWRKVGTASGSAVSVQALAWIMVGHMRHHMSVLTERYGLTT
jgi:hypothetical protein